METVYETRARVFKALCDERRQRILELLQGGEKCACVLIDAMDRSSVTSDLFSPQLRLKCTTCQRHEKPCQI